MRAFIIFLAAATTAASAQTTRTLQLVWRAGGGDGDTSFADISTIAVAPNGDVLAYDRKSSALHLFSDLGKRVRAVGRKGAGPGEFNYINGMAFGADGRFYVWDGGNARLNLYDAKGDFERQIPVPAGLMSNALTIDDQGRAWLRYLNFDRPTARSKVSWIRVPISGNGLVDTVKAPEMPGSDQQLIARSSSGTGVNNIPYGRYPVLAVSNSGEIVAALAGKYELTMSHRGKPVNIRRSYTPVRITEEEREELKSRIEWNMRRIQADWTWPIPVPSEKPAFQSFVVGLDGRLWVSLHTESEKFAADPPATTDRNAPPPTTFRPAGRKWDVFSADGKYIGTVAAPRTIDIRVMRGDFAWGISYDEDDVPTLAKLRIFPALGPR